MEAKASVRTEQDAASRLGERLVEAIAAEDGSDPLELSPPLYRSVDLEALEALFREERPDSDLRVSFTYRGYRVRVANGGQVTVTERSDRDRY